jgi:hypothetical protein
MSQFLQTFSSVSAIEYFPLQSIVSRWHTYISGANETTEHRMFASAKLLDTTTQKKKKQKSHKCKYTKSGSKFEQKNYNHSKTPTF